uniref:(northern house mosquito) hypothetical protein n=2 Tax=Culex pipiens TaxID=7175 RepID=A0A8D8L5T4_CULPI
MDRPTISVLKDAFRVPLPPAARMIDPCSRTASDGRVMMFFVGESGYRDEVADLTMLNLTGRWSSSVPRERAAVEFRTRNLMLDPSGGIRALVADADDDRMGLSGW